MEAKSKPLVFCLKLTEWPDGDQVSWAAGCSPGDIFDDPKWASGKSPATIKMTRKGYARWLGFLSQRGWLDPAEPPFARITVPRLRAYFQDMKAAGNADLTIIGRFDQLARAMRILDPECNPSWIRRPCGMTFYAFLPKRQRPKQAPDISVLWSFAKKLMDSADRSDPRGLIDYRDGLLIAFFTSRARRLRAMASLRIGREIKRSSGVYRIELTPDLVKTGKYDDFSMPESLTPYIDYYLEVVRPGLLARFLTDAFWVSWRSGPLSEKSIQERVFKRVKERFGKGFGPHRFRHSLITSATLQAPNEPWLGPAALRITGQVAEQHYNLATQVAAGCKLEEMIDSKRRASSRAAAKLDQV